MDQDCLTLSDARSVKVDKMNILKKRQQHLTKYQSRVLARDLKIVMIRKAYALVNMMVTFEFNHQVHQVLRTTRVEVV